MPDAFLEVLLLMTMTLVIDACVAIKFVTREMGTDQANALLASENALIAPDLMQIETAHGLWKKVAAEEILQMDAVAGLAALPELFERFVPASDLLHDAQALSFTLNHSIYDCFYLALAQRENALLVTADKKFWNAAKRAQMGEHVQLLEWPLVQMGEGQF